MNCFLRYGAVVKRFFSDALVKWSGRTGHSDNPNKSFYSPLHLSKFNQTLLEALARLKSISLYPRDYFIHLNKFLSARGAVLAA